MTDEDDTEVVPGHRLVGSACSCGDWEASLGTSIWRGFDKHLIAVSLND